MVNAGWVFGRAHSLEELDLSNWDTSRMTHMEGMFSETTSLRELRLGVQFRFRISSWGNARLPAIPPNTEVTGYWQNVGSGTVDNPTGVFVLTSAQLMLQFNGATMADIFVWQPVR